jgi:predicted RNA binding protein YcfA (HicA-like mRNA interferase family)
MSRMRRMNADEVEKILQRYGFVPISQKGSHRKWRNLKRKLQAIIPIRRL